LEKYKSGIKDFKDIVSLCEKEDKESKQSNLGMHKLTPKNAKSKRDHSENKNSNKTIFSKLPRMLIDKMLFITNRSNKLEECMDVLKNKCTDQNETIHALKKEVTESRSRIKYSPSRLESK